MKERLSVLRISMWDITKLITSLRTEAENRKRKSVGAQERCAPFLFHRKLRPVNKKPSAGRTLSGGQWFLRRSKRSVDCAARRSRKWFFEHALVLEICYNIEDISCNKCMTHTSQQECWSILEFC